MDRRGGQKEKPEKTKNKGIVKNKENEKKEILKERRERERKKK